METNIDGVFDPEVCIDLYCEALEGNHELWKVLAQFFVLFEALDTHFQRRQSVFADWIENELEDSENAESVRRFLQAPRFLSNMREGLTQEYGVSSKAEALERRDLTSKAFKRDSIREFARNLESIRKDGKYFPPLRLVK